MTSYRAYVVTLSDPTGQSVLYLSHFPQVSETLRFFAGLWCSESVCVHSPDQVIMYDRVWFVDGFVGVRPDGLVMGFDHVVNVCPRAILEALNG